MIHFKDAFDNSPSINTYKLSEPYFNHIGHHIYRICHFLGWHIWRWSDINIQINHFSMKQHVDQQGMRCKGRRKSIVFVIESYWHSNHVMLSFQIWGTDSNFIIVSWLSGKFKLLIWIRKIYKKISLFVCTSCYFFIKCLNCNNKYFPSLFKYHANVILLTSRFCLLPDYKFCTWHSSCAKIGGDLTTRNYIQAK